MELINWSIGAIGKIVSIRQTDLGEPVCPDAMFAAGYMMDSWERWRVVCLSVLSVEDVEDVYLFWLMMTGFLQIGFCD